MWVRLPIKSRSKTSLVAIFVDHITRLMYLYKKIDIYYGNGIEKIKLAFTYLVEKIPIIKQ